MESFLFYSIARATLLMFRALPRVLGSRILNLLAGVLYFLDAKHRRIADINLRIAFPDLSREERRRIARRSFQLTAQNLLEVGRLSSLSKENIASLVEYDPESGLNNYEVASARGKPILYLTGHFSSWELLPTAHALYGHPLSFVTRPLDNPWLENYLRGVRQAAGNVVISKKNSIRKILKTLNSSGSVGILMDQNTDPQEGVFVDFFGIPACTSSSVALLALRTDATVLPGYLTPVRKNRYRIKFLPPLELTRTDDMAHDVIANTRLFNCVLESIVREQPESWLWGHKRWSYQPQLASGDLYRLSDEHLEHYLQDIRRHARLAPPPENAPRAGNKKLSEVRASHGLADGEGGASASKRVKRSV